MSRRAAERLLIAQALHEGPPKPLPRVAFDIERAMSTGFTNPWKTPQIAVGIDFGGPGEKTGVAIMRQLDHGKLELMSLAAIDPPYYMPKGTRFVANPPERGSAWEKLYLGHPTPPEPHSDAVRKLWAETFPEAEKLTRATLERGVAAMRAPAKPTPFILPPAGLSPTGRRRGGLPHMGIRGRSISSIIMDDPLEPVPKTPEELAAEADALIARAEREADEEAFRGLLREMKGEPTPRAVSVDVKVSIVWDSASAMSEDEWAGRSTTKSSSSSSGA